MSEMPSRDVLAGRALIAMRGHAKVARAISTIEQPCVHCDCE